MNRYLKTSVFATINVFVIYFIWSRVTEYTDPIVVVDEEGHHGEGNDSDRVSPHLLLSESKQINIDETTSTIDGTLARATLTDSSGIDLSPSNPIFTSKIFNISNLVRN